MTAQQAREKIERDLATRQLRDAFARDFGARRAKWGAHNLGRMLNATGDPREKIDSHRAILGDLGLGHDVNQHGMYRFYRQISPSGVFDHGEMWSVGGLPSILVGHPYGVTEDQRDLLNRLGRCGGLRVSIDDRPSYYGHGTNHVRVEIGTPDYDAMTDRELGIIQLSDYAQKALAH